MASTLAQRYKEQITRPIHRTKALKGEKQEDHFQDVVGVSFRCRSGKRRFLQTVLTKLIIEESSRDTFLSCSNKKNLFVDYFHFLLGPLPWQRSETGVPNASVCVKGHMNYGLTLTEGLILIDPELIIFGRPQSSPVSRCYNVDPDSIHRLLATPANERL